ncbi:SH3 domain-containing protein [Saccharomonospora saliphila]|uniref:hypothetical protein n=1 Tax=Saccharomonospora saliphila TaxID=369829 RepID=UPI0003A95FF6|nr:hypothetical protein [Saccharomonospora saliphila]
MLGIPKRALIVVAVAFGLALIYTTGSEQRESEAESGGSGDAAGCRVTVTADVLNVRAGPGTGHDIVGKYTEDAETDATTEVREGFRRIAEGRWAADEFLTPTDGADCG